MKNVVLIILAVLVAFAVLPALLAQTYNIPWHRVGPGGTSAGGALAVSGTAGQWDAGTMSGGNLSLSGGFWASPTATASPAMQYTLVDLGLFPGDPRAVNNIGQIAGYRYTSDGYAHAAFWPNTGTSPVGLGGLGGDGSGALGMNDSGQIVGQAYLMGNSIYHAAIWTNGSAAPIDLGSLGFGRSSAAASLNRSGQIVGQSDTPTNWSLPVFWANSTSPPRELRTFGGIYSYAGSINDSGQIVGASSPAGSSSTHAAFWPDSSSAPVDLGTLGRQETVARAVNRSGQIVGWSTDWSSSPPVLPLYWANSRSSPVRLAALGNNSEAVGINASGRIVGYSVTGLNGPLRAVMWNNGMSAVTDLNSLIPANSGWVLQYANAINDSGEIVGSGTLGGETHAFALVPSVWALRIAAVGRSGSSLQLSFTSQAVHTYTVLSASNLVSGPWMPLQTGIAGNGGTVQVTIPNAFVQPRQFFRIQQAP